MKLLPTLAATALLTTSFYSNALVIDFTDSTKWGTPASPQTQSYTSASGMTFNVQVQAFRNNGNPTNYTFNAGEAHSSCMAVTGLACNGDGLGVRNDEISGGSNNLQKIEVRFFDETNNPLSLDFLNVQFLDLFANEGQNNSQAEVATILFDTPPTTSVTGTATDRLGFASYDASGTSSSTLTALVLDIADTGFMDFSLAAITIDEGSDAFKVAEPASLALFGLGLLGFGYSSRQRKPNA
ncbi:PEP-CTERM sorting domain-containing protein [Photobacterium sanctipauli]|uniref:PEP-CTERM sorting domain-containing protein n=1 Tax=Photobacterium sanctipauli TaxID=1342794 RepID=A0A2T3NWU0_9GAMM|nr:PEP-CTERM sorting domain-containing protein [Photobacterium sanctipauli]PSW20760.1 PEP-CTERM sorting domain-containing protein [Photobacterium sanctipauli]